MSRACPRRRPTGTSTTALAALVVEPADAGYRFRHALVREALLAAMPAARARPRPGASVAERLAALGAAPARVAHQLLAAGLPGAAVPFVLRAVETAGRPGRLPRRAGPGRRGPRRTPGPRTCRGCWPGEATCSSRWATRRRSRPTGRPSPSPPAPSTGWSARGWPGRPRSRAISTPPRAALAGLELEGDAADGPILLARGQPRVLHRRHRRRLASVGTRPADLLQPPDDPWQFVDLISLQGLIAHQRGEWFERFRLELRRTRGKQRLATALFDAHLCVAEYLLYGPVPYAEVIGARRGAARQRPTGRRPARRRVRHRR